MHEVSVRFRIIHIQRPNSPGETSCPLPLSRSLKLAMFSCSDPASVASLLAALRTKDYVWDTALAL
jgi:hypothetical protein